MIKGKEFNKYKNWGAYHWSLYEDKSNSSYKEHVNYVISWVKGDNLLDIGAGDGLLTHLLKGKGIDDDETAVKCAKEKGADVIFGSSYEIPFEKEFDTVFMGDVIEHLEFPELAIEEVKRVLRPDGIFYVATPPLASNGKVQDKYHYKEYTSVELKDFIESFGFTLLEPIVIKHQRMYAKFSLNS